MTPVIPDLILPVGPESASVMFILDSASEDDMKTGVAFSGAMVRDIRSLCKDAGIHYDTTYRTLLYKTRLPYNGKSKKKFQASLDEIKAGRADYGDILIQEIVNIKPKVIVPLGELAFNFVAAEKSITKFRGSVLPLRPDIQSKVGPSIVRVIPTLGPKYIYEDYANKVILSVDFAKIKTASEAFGPILDPTIVWVADTIDKFNNYLFRYPNPSFGVFDIETRFNIPVCIGFCFSPTEACCVPLLDQTLDTANRVLLWKKVADLLWNNPRWVNQNIKYDLLILERFLFKFQESHIVGDTALRSSVIYPELKKGLGFLNSIYTDMPYFKDEGKDVKDRKMLYLYCAKDCLSTYQIYLKQEVELEEQGLKDFNSHVHSLFWPYIRIERRGIAVDGNKKLKLLAKYDTYYNFHCTVLSKLCGSIKINPLSPSQVSELLYEDLKFPARRDRKTNNYKTDEETLEELITFHGEENTHGLTGKRILETIIGCRKLHKVIEYCQTSIHPDSRMRCSYDLGGTKTGRSATKTTTDYLLVNENGKWITSQCGRGLHTIGKHGFKIGGEWYGRDLRSIFVPSPGYIFVEGDLSQAEARVDAVLAEDYEFLKLFDIKPGVHIKTGEWIFGYTIDKHKEPEKYHIAKTVRHAAERNMYGDRLAMIIQEPKQFCEDLLDKLHKAQPNIRNVFHFQVKEFVKQHRFLVSPQGRRRDFFGRQDHHMFNEAISQIPQATVSDQMKFSLPLLEAEATYAQFVYEGHDALMAEIKKEELPMYAKTFHRIVERPIDFSKCSLSRDIQLVIPAEIMWSDETWEDMRDYEE